MKLLILTNFLNFNGSSRCDSRQQSFEGPDEGRPVDALSVNEISRAELPTAVVQRDLGIRIRTLNQKSAGTPTSRKPFDQGFFRISRRRAETRCRQPCPVGGVLNRIQYDLPHYAQQGIQKVPHTNTVARETSLVTSPNAARLLSLVVNYILPDLHEQSRLPGLAWIKCSTPLATQPFGLTTHPATSC